MELEFVISTLLIALVLITLRYNIRRTFIYEFERGLRFKRGKFEKTLEPGAHWYLRSTQSIRKIDIRSRTVSIPGQEVLSADNIGLKISLVCTYHIDDPYLAVVKIADVYNNIYIELQILLRDLIGSTQIDDLLANRGEIGDAVLERAKTRLSNYGVNLEMVAIKDIMFPGDLKQIFAQVVNARKEGQAALERARGESAALRNLANTAALLEKNPGLLQLRIIQAIDNNPNAKVVLGDISGANPGASLIEGGETD